MQNQNRRLRKGIFLGLLVCSVGLSFFVEPRVIDFGGGWLVSEIFCGAILFWPLSDVFVRVLGRNWGLFLSLLPTLLLVWIRFQFGTREYNLGSPSTLMFGSMIFISILSFAAYLIFFSLPSARNKREKE